MSAAELEQIERDMALCRDAGITKVQIPMALVERMLETLKQCERNGR